MDTIWTILGLGAGMYALRLGGMVLRDATVPPAWERTLRFVPVALLTALVLVSMLGQAGAERDVRLLGAVGGALVARWTGKMWACILAGMAVYGVLRVVMAP